MTTTQAAATAEKPGKARSLTGRVTSDKMQKTVTVTVERKVRHPMMGKIVTRSKKFHAHVELEGVATGDMVEITECRPISKTKSWRVTRLIQKGSGD